MVIIDGVVLPRGTETIQRPVQGATMNVLVRAEKHEDTILMIDSASPEELDVALVPSAVGVVAPAPTPRRLRLLDAGVSKDSKESKDPPRSTRRPTPTSSAVREARRERDPEQP